MHVAELSYSKSQTVETQRQAGASNGIVMLSEKIGLLHALPRATGIKERREFSRSNRAARDDFHRPKQLGAGFDVSYGDTAAQH